MLSIERRSGALIATLSRPPVNALNDELVTRFAAMPRAALVACKGCIAAAADPNRDGFGKEFVATRTFYDHPETRRRVSDFLDHNARP